MTTAPAVTAWGQAIRAVHGTTLNCWFNRAAPTASSLQSVALAAPRPLPANATQG